MIRNAYSKNIIRTVTGNLGRFIAILAIIALGVGFFTGIKGTKASMINTCDKYVKEMNMYDYRIVSSIGITGEDVKGIKAADGVKDAEGAVTQDFFAKNPQGSQITVRAHSITHNINKLSLKEGRLPEKADECVGDAMHFSKEDIGSYITVSGENDKDTKSNLKYDKYKLTGLVDSVYYLQRTERGISALGDGTVNAFIYMPKEGFDTEYYTDLFLTLKEGGFVYSDAYETNVEKYSDGIEKTAKDVEKARYDDLMEEAQSKLDEKYDDYNKGVDEYNAEKAKAYNELGDAKRKLDSSKRQVAVGKKEIEDNRAKLAANKKDLTEKRKQATDALKELGNGIAGMEAAGLPKEQIAPLQAKYKEVEGSIAQIDGGLAKVDAGKKQLAQKEKELKSAETKIEKGYREYNRNYAEAERQLASAATELDDAKTKLDKAQKKLDGRKAKEPEVYLYTREDNTGFASFDDNASIVDSIAKIFPIFFLLIAILVCSTTMTRMIEEERGQIGCLLALGYTKGRIMKKYIIYSGTAALTGCLLGFYLGSKFFPWAIWHAYGILFGFAPIKILYSPVLFTLSVIVSLACSAGATFFALRAQMKEMPAQILRPKAPEAGKRIFLERIKPFWKRLKFLHKVTARNIFRYKKRMVMMIMGIAGCTALVLAGLGIYDSIAGVADYQYDEIDVYDMTAYYSGEEGIEETEKDDGKYIETLAPFQKSTVTSEQLSLSLIASDMPNRLEKVINFRNPETGDEVKYPKYGEAMINEKVAEVLDIKEGDEITVMYDDVKKASLKVTGIYRNYVSNYVYITKDTLTDVFGKEYEPSTAYISIKEGMDKKEAMEAINSNEDVLAVSLNDDTRARVADMMRSLDFIIWLVIASAAALAFIVLFNLSNINITERQREIATIKVLGFFPRETGSYVFRENFVLVIMGIIVGYPLGMLLHKFIMHNITVGMIAFNDIIAPLSYVYGGLLVMAFAVFTDIIMRRKLRKINMAEALKSVE